MNHFPSHAARGPLSAALAAACLAPAAGAQSATPVQQVVVTGNPFQRDTLPAPAQALSGEALLLRRQATLGDTLDGLPGVATTWFGPNAGRPVIRGLDGDRVRLLDNGGATVDASNLSFDHAVAIDPLVVERIEVLRGPAALLYGGNATGGIVNAIDHRIPQQPLEGLSGRAEARFGGAADERALSALVEGGAGGLGWHVDAFRRSASDLRVPRHVPRAGNETLPVATRVRNSAGESDGGAVGLGWVGKDARLGMAVDRHESRYGVTADEEVTIGMHRDRVAVAGAWGGLSVQASDTDYVHREFEGAELGTTFASRGRELRVQWRHAPIGPLEGVLGVQRSSMRFSALGDEAFVPGTHTRQEAVFVLESLRLGALELSAGLRRERVRVASEGDADPAAGPRFGDPQARRFTPGAWSLGGVWAATHGWSLSASVGRTERAPAYYELYADGVHVATGAYEIGDPTLGLERSLHAEAGVAWRDGPHRFAVQAYRTRFANYIALDATGGTQEDLPVYRFRGVPARLQGFEIEASTGGQAAGWRWQLDGVLDRVRGRDLEAGEPLPRLAPMRSRLAFALGRGSWDAVFGIRHAARQDRVPATDTATPGHALVDVSLRRRVGLGGTDTLWHVGVRNLGDRLAYSATTVGSLRGLVPLPGRALTAGVQASF